MSVRNGGAVVVAGEAHLRQAGIIRPRTTGEVLDDAWRLYFADAPLLLALSGLFAVPAAIVLLLLLAEPPSQPLAWRLLLTALTATLLPLTGLGSGACQELFRRRAAGEPVTLHQCLGGALVRGLDHIAGRGLFLPCFIGLGAVASVWALSLPLALAALILGMLALPTVFVLSAGSAVHPIVAEREKRLFAALLTSLTEASRHGSKVLVAMGCCLPLLLLAVLNLWLLVAIGLWVAGSLGGLDTALAEILVSPSNPTYRVAMVLLAWVLLTPFVEATNYLLHVDARARHEGLDLWYRVQHLLRVTQKGPAVAFLPALAAGLLGVLPARTMAQDEDPVKEVQERLTVLRQEVEQASPYPGGGRWLPRLQEMAHRLDPRGNSTSGPYRWFYQALDRFAQRDQAGAVQVLVDLSQRLEVVAESRNRQRSEPTGGAGPSLSRDEIKRLVPQRSDAGDNNPGKTEKPTRKEDQRRVREEAEEGDVTGPAPRSGPGLVPAVAAGGLGLLGWCLLIGLLLAIVVVACVLFLQNRGEPRPAKAKTETGKAAALAGDPLSQPHLQNATALWRQADGLAKAGKHLEAVRTLYAAVLAFLHQANLIRWEATRTNGEYAGQLQGNADAPAELHTVFQRLTSLFELKWYGERACRPEDYPACRELAEEIRSLV